MQTKHFLILISIAIFIALVNPTSCSNSPNTHKSNFKSETTNLHNDTLNKPFKGIYVASEWHKPIAEYVLENQDVNGVFLRLYWDRLQPSEDKFDWLFLDSELKRIINAQKKISIGVAAGSHSPEWIYAADVPGLNFDEFRHQGKGKLFSVKIPVPWNEKYLQLWTTFIQSFSAYLKSKPDVYEKITLIKLTGINETTIEIRLPAQKNISNEKGNSTDAPAIWKGAGYKPQLIRNAWNRILQCYLDNFDGKYVSIAVIPKRAFPAIDESGKEINANNSDEFTEELITAGYEKFKSRFVVQWNSLKENANIPGLMLFVNKFGIAKGFQIAEAEFANPDCLENKTACDNDMFKSVVDLGIDNDAAFIEIFPKDVLAFPRAISHGYEKMTK